MARYTDDLVSELRHLVKVRLVHTNVEWSRVAARKMADDMSEGDIAHIQHYPDYFGDWRNPLKTHYFRVLSGNIRIPLVVTIHGLTPRLRYRRFADVNLKSVLYNALAVPIINHTPFGRFMTGGFLDLAEHIIVQTSEIKRFLGGRRIRAEKISVLYPGVPHLPSSNVSMKEMYGLDGRRVMTIFGFILPVKGHDIAVDALRLLPRDVVLLIGGGIRGEYGSSYFDKLKALIESLGLGDRVVVTGYLEDDMASAVLSGSDVVLLPYRSTDMSVSSYALSSALASGRPVITSDLPFFCEIERKYSAIRTFQEGNARDLADAVMEVLSCGVKEEGRAKAYREMWTWKNVAERTYRVYCRVLKRECPECSDTVKNEGYATGGTGFSNGWAHREYGGD